MIGGGVVAGHAPDGAPVIRYPAVAPALILVGSMMLRTVAEIDWQDPTEYIPAFLTLVGIPLTFSISTGVAFGFIGYAAGKLVSGRARECPALVYVFAALLALLLVLH